MLISVIVPMYNESEGLKQFHNKHLLPALKNIKGKTFEIIYVNDGSKDSTLELLHEVAKKDTSVRVINLSKNFGKEIATTAGINTAKGEAIVILDGDGQHPPTKIKELIAAWEEGAQVVIGVRNSNQKEGFVKKWGSKLFYKAFNSSSGAEIIPRSTDFRLISKSVQKEFKTFTERNRITRGLIDWLGFKRAYVSFDSPARIAGEASYTTRQLVRLAVNSFISLSLKPLFFFGWIGVIITLVSLSAGIFIFIEQFILQDPLGLNFTGAALLGIFISFLVGLVLISQGMMAIYLSHVHAQTQQRPLFVIDYENSKGVEDER